MGVGKGRLTTEKTLADTGHSRVYLVRRKTDQQLCVLKTSTKGNDLMAHERDIFKNHLFHGYKRIITLLDTSVSKFDGLLFNYYPGGDLDHYIETRRRRDRHPFSEETIWCVFKQLAEALAYTHHGLMLADPHYAGPLHAGTDWQAVIHRDIKPMNVFLRNSDSSATDAPSVVLADFGHATTEGTTYLISTPIWQPPEIPKCTKAGDVWMIGAAVYAMIHEGKPPCSRPPRGVSSSGKWYEMPEARKLLPTPSRYSRTLHRVLEESLAWDDRKRATALELTRKIRKEM